MYLPMYLRKTGLLDAFSNKGVLPILDFLVHWRLQHWGFVIIRGTYSSQAKWDKFVQFIKEDTHDYLEQRAMLHLYDKAAWTVVEDAATLNNASLEVAQKRFEDWLHGDEGEKDRAGSLFGDGVTGFGGARYDFFLCVDEESLESVVDEGKAKEEGGYTVKILMRGADEGRGQNEEGAEEEEEGLDEDDRERELQDVRKRVRVDALVKLYAQLLPANSWYILPVEDGIIDI
ncbi:uncharacterized protein C8A04DRAFT_40310 [Dichotomopilus funicola]|uniref:Uncharacterized protein n=1 Tax=Dichotomopilus funicola TaxID=1934379 RepID=A0AAN6ZJB9_9PEZI|nr:hypothetical protein C8A04DRAFT_40310 [Dichotomopilus funicola]